MSIVLTHGYYLNKDPKEASIMKPYAPLGLLYLSSYLNQEKIKNHVFDSTFSNQETQLDFIAREKPLVVAIYTNLMTKITVIKLIKLLIASLIIFFNFVFFIVIFLPKSSWVFN